MRARLWLKKKVTRLANNPKGFSSIIGSVFMVLVVLLLSTGVFMWTLSQNTMYNEAVRARNQEEADRRYENVVATNGNYTVSGNVVTVVATLTNAGPVAAQIINLWVFDTSKQTYGFNNSLASMTAANLNPGQVLNLNGANAMKVTVPNAEPLHGFNIWFVTARGNTVPLTKSQGIIMAQVSQGIGSISFDFEQFWHYEFSTQPADGTPLPSKSPNNYTISANNYTVFHVVVTNLDPLGKDIVLNGNSSIYIICAQKSTVKYGTWGLVNVTANKIYPSSGAQYCLKYGNTIEIYFAGTLPQNPDLNTAYPLNVLLLGRKGNNDYGQNIPFVSIYLVS